MTLAGLSELYRQSHLAERSSLGSNAEIRPAFSTVRSKMYHQHWRTTVVHCFFGACLTSTQHDGRREPRPVRHITARKHREDDACQVAPDQHHGAIREAAESAGIGAGIADAIGTGGVKRNG